MGFVRVRSIIFALLAGAAVVVLGMKYAYMVRERRLQALFSGPYETSQVVQAAYYPRFRYDLEAYKSYTAPSSGAEVIPLLEKKPELRPKWIGQTEAVEAVTAATMSVEDRLQWRSAYKERIPLSSLWITYPPDGAVFPPNFCEPIFEWENRANNLWQVTVGVSGTSLMWSFLTDKPWWQSRPEVWRVLREKAVEGDAWIQVKGLQRTGRDKRTGDIQASQVVHFRISADPADPYVVYRLVTPQFQTMETPDLFARDIRSFDVKPILRARGKYCFNCHTFSSKGGREGRMSIKVYFMDTGGAPLSSLGIFDRGSGKVQKIQVPYPKGFTFMEWNREGDKLAMSVNQGFASSTPIIHETQQLDFSSSDIAVYEPSRGLFSLVPGADSPDYIELFPAWTPGHTKLLFSRANVGVNAREVKYDLYVLDYNDGKGGVPVAVLGASHNGQSNYFARYSPDGKWVSFCRANQGSLIESSSDIYLLPGDLEGPSHRLECNADYAADSWHSWSSNSRWLVFASKRDDGIYARLYLTHMDKEGHASPAVRLPVKGLILKSFNIPEFLADVFQLEERRLFGGFRAEAPVETARIGEASR